MLKKEDCSKQIKQFNAKHALDISDENIIATLHLMNTHGVDVNAALDQSSRSNNDRGIDAWHYEDKNGELFIYQSKLSESKNIVMKGLSDLNTARQWIEQVIVDGAVEKIPDNNHCLFNLYTFLSKNKSNLSKMHFKLISLFDINEIEDSDEYEQFNKTLIESELNSYLRNALNAKISPEYVAQYNLEKTVPEKIKKYTISRIPETQIDLRQSAHLDLAYLSLFNLIELYRQRGDVLFEKNVRLSLMNTKEAKDRLVHPMEDTFNQIVEGKLNPNVFPFYHIGVTLSAKSSTSDSENILNLEAPSIINGCQTITIANEYFKKLEKINNEEKINRFKQIKVIAKVVVGTSNEELKEITNSNNRQNPIENWQLFSNEPVHIEIEAALKESGIFYERQRGKYDTVMKNTSNAQYYSNTNGTNIKIMELGQIVAIVRKQLQWGAKPSEIFINKENHDSIFDKNLSGYTEDMIFITNLFKALKRGMANYLNKPVHINSHAPVIFNKQTIKANVYYLGILYIYQHKNKANLRNYFSKSLSKIANVKLVEETYGFYQKIITQIKKWYVDESKDFTIEISKKRMDKYFSELSVEIGIEENGALPFSEKSISYDE